MTTTTEPARDESRAGIPDRVRQEGPITLVAASYLVPARTPRGHASPATLQRWIISGKRKVKLEAVRIRGEWHTSIHAIGRFLAALNIGPARFA